MGDCSGQLIGSANHTYTDCCPRNFDGLQYWPSTPANTTVRQTCHIFKDIIYTEHTYVYRHCFPNSTWEPKADYSDCMPTDAELAYSTPMVKTLYTIFWIGYPLSLFLCLLALVIFFRYRNLWCLRNIIHSNFILCFALHNALWIVYSLIYHEFQLTTTTFIQCIIPLALLRFFICAAFFWMFVEGLYIFINLLYSLHSPKINFWSCFFIGWVLPIFPVSYAVFIAENDLSSERCLDISHSNIDYLVIVPIVIIITANFVFLCKILYAVTSKLRLSVTNKFQIYSKTVRALLVLCPLLGINFMFSLYHPTHPRWLNIGIHYVSTILSSSQVQDCIGRSFAALKLKLTIRKERKRRGSSRRSEHSQITLLSVPPSPTPFNSE